MKCFIVMFCCVFSFFVIANAQHCNSLRTIEKYRRIPVIDDLIEELSYEQWDEDEQICLRDTLIVLNNVKNATLWATWIWDSMQSPMGILYGSRYQLGNFDQCMKMPWPLRPLRTQYCLAEVQLTNPPLRKSGRSLDPYASTESYLHTASTQGRHLNSMTWGVCVPGSCAPRTVAKLVWLLRDHIHLLSLANASITVDPRDCQLAGTTHQYSTGFLVFFGLAILLFIVAVISTFSSKNDPRLSLDIITKSFCFKRNWQDLIKLNKNEIQVMSGMRFITAVITVSIHEMLYLFPNSINNALDIDVGFSTYLGLLLHIDVVIDTFFAMSGLLLIKGLMSNKSGRQNLFLVLLKRYIRLIGPYGVITFYLVSVASHVGSGPLWSRLYRDEIEICQRNWWMNFLMLNTDMKSICYEISWYIPCDYQLAVLGTVLFFLYRRNKRQGVTAFIAVTSLITINLAAVIYWKKLTAMPCPYIEDLADLRKSLPNLTYTASYGRAGAYLVGIAMGYFMSIYNPAKYRKVIPKKWCLFGTMLALAAMAMIMNLGKVLYNREYDALEAAAAVSLNRIVWAVAACSIIGFSEYGAVPLISDFLSWSVFSPLSRLSYGIYVIHPMIIQRNLFAVRSPMTYDFFTVILNTFGTTVCACFASLVMYLLVEAPLINMTNALLFRS